MKNETIRRRRVEGGTRIELLLDGEPVSGLLVLPRRMRIGRSVLPMGGIGGVGTRKEFRLRGYAKRCLLEAIDFMRESGHVVSVLFGIPNFYQKVGFAVWSTEAELKVPTRRAEKADGPGRARRMTPADAPAVRRLYAADSACLSGSIVRPRTWKGFEMAVDWGSGPEPYVIEQGGRVQAYAVLQKQPDAVTVAELGAAHPRFFGSLARLLGRIAVRRRCEHVSFRLPPEHPFIDYCGRHSGELTLRFGHDGGAMARILDQPELLRRIAPELEARVLHSPLRDWRGIVAFQTDLGRGLLDIRPGRVRPVDAGRPTTTVKLPQWALLQGMLGYRGLEDLELDRTAVVRGPRDILPVLLPRSAPYMWRPDRF